MNGLKLSLVVASTLFLIGCGGGASDDSTLATSEPLTEMKTLDDAKSNFKALSALDSMNMGSLQNQNKASGKLSYKTTQTYQCETGTISITDDGSNSTMVGDKCSNNGTYLDGTFSMVSNNGTDKIVLSNLTMISDGIEMSAKYFVIEGNDAEKWSTLDGDMKVVTKCFSGNYNYKTVERLVETADGTELVSGILELNGARYTFANSNVTIKVGATEDTIPQSELEKRMSTGTTCTE